MKKIKSQILFVLCVFIFVSGCTPVVKLTDRHYDKKIFGIDFRSFNEKGFLFYTEEYFGAYELLGMIEVEIHPEVKYKAGRVIEDKTTVSDGIYHRPSNRQLQIPEPESGYDYQIIRVNGKIFTKNVQKIHINELIKQMYQLSIEMGGDALTHFKAHTRMARTDIYETTSYPYYSVSGLVIKRK